MTDPWHLLQERRRSSPGSPVVTYLDLAHGQRVELSAQSLENAAAKIGNALRSEFDLEAGAVVALHLPVHWQRAAWCAGVWTAGCVVAPDGDAGSADLVVTTTDRVGALIGLAGGSVAVVSLHPFGLPIEDALPVGAFDVTVAVRQQPDAYIWEPPAGALDALRIDGTVLTQAQALESAAERAVEWGLIDGGILLAGEDLDPVDAWLCAVAVPLVTGGSVVLAAGGVPSDDVVDRERVTARARR